MNDTHRVSRVVHFPQAFPNRVFDRASLLFFRASDAEKDNPNRTYKMSVVCRCVMPDNDSVHLYGTQIQDSQNARLEEELGHFPTHEKKRVYLGFFDVSYDSVASVVLEYYKVCMAAVPEDGQVAHMEIHFRSLCKDSTEKRRRADRSAAIKWLSEQVSEPTLFGGVTEPSQIEMQNQLVALR